MRLSVHCWCVFSLRTCSAVRVLLAELERSAFATVNDCCHPRDHKLKDTVVEGRQVVDWRSCAWGMLQTVVGHTRVHGGACNRPQDKGSQGRTRKESFFSWRHLVAPEEKNAPGAVGCRCLTSPADDESPRWLLCKRWRLRACRPLMLLTRIMQFRTSAAASRLAIHPVGYAHCCTLPYSSGYSTSPLSRLETSLLAPCEEFPAIPSETILGGLGNDISGLKQ
jgi:hypothetical protein